MVLMFAAVHYTIQYMGMIQSVCKVYMVQCNSASSCTIHNNVSNACMYKSICIRPPVCTLYPPLYSIKCMQVICTSTVCIKRLYIAMNEHYRYVQRIYVMEVQTPYVHVISFTYSLIIYVYKLHQVLSYMHNYHTLCITFCMIVTPMTST